MSTHLCVMTAAGLVLALAACDGNRGERGILPSDTVPVAPPIPEAAPSLAPPRVGLEEMNLSGTTGEAVVIPEAEETRVRVSVANAPPHNTLAARIQSGQCDSQGPVVTTLASVRTDAAGMGRSETLVELPAHRILDGAHYVQIHEARGEPGAAVACGDLPARPELHPGIEEPG